MAPAADIFSVGCVICELFRDGNAPFQLPDLLRYSREGVAPPSLSTAYEKLRDERVRNLVDQMLQRDPSSRLSAKQHIEDNTGPEKLFPDYFGTFMFPFFRRVLSSSLASPDARVWYVCEHYSEIFQSVLGARDAKGARFFEERKRDDGSNERVVEHLLQDEVDTLDESPVSIFSTWRGAGSGTRVARCGGKIHGAGVKERQNVRRGSR